MTKEMKKRAYISPEMTFFNVAPMHQLLAGSSGESVAYGDVAESDNNIDGGNRDNYSILGRDNNGVPNIWDEKW